MADSLTGSSSMPPTLDGPPRISRKRQNCHDRSGLQTAGADSSTRFPPERGLVDCPATSLPVLPQKNGSHGCGPGAISCMGPKAAHPNEVGLGPPSRLPYAQDRGQRLTTRPLHWRPAVLPRESPLQSPGAPRLAAPSAKYGNHRARSPWKSARFPKCPGPR